MPVPVSYAQRFEDVHLSRCFGDRADGFYIDVGAGHPVYDNVSFAFYLKGWRGITVEPNPRLSQLAAAVRPRDISLQMLVGAAAGEATFYLVEEFHGFSTMLASNAEAARREFGKGAQALTLPVTTLADLCARHAPPAIDFLKVDVEGAEEDVLRGNDWTRFRPRVVLAEALAPYTLAPAYEAWEALLRQHGYRYAGFDNLNRYYVAEEAAELLRGLAPTPNHVEGVRQFGTIAPPLEDRDHPDHALAALLARAVMRHLPLIDPAAVIDLLGAELAPGSLERPARPDDLPAVFERLMGRVPTAAEAAAVRLGPGATLRELYGVVIGSDAFRTAAGRISASQAW